MKLSLRVVLAVLFVVSLVPATAWAGANVGSIARASSKSETAWRRDTSVRRFQWSRPFR